MCTQQKRTYPQQSTQDTPDLLTVHGGLRLHVSERLYDGTPPGVVMGCCLRQIDSAHKQPLIAPWGLAWTANGGATLYVEARGQGWGSNLMHDMHELLDFGMNLIGEGSCMNTDVKRGPYIRIRMNWQKIIFTCSCIARIVWSLELST